MDIQNRVTPHELEFTVDDVINQGVDKAIKTYEQTVSLNLLVFVLQCL